MRPRRSRPGAGRVAPRRPEGTADPRAARHVPHPLLPTAERAAGRRAGAAPRPGDGQPAACPARGPARAALTRRRAVALGRVGRMAKTALPEPHTEAGRTGLEA